MMHGTMSLKTKFDFWKCYKQKPHSCSKGNSRTKITDTFLQNLTFVLFPSQA